MAPSTTTHCWDIWNAAANNLRRRVEVYGPDLWQSVVKDDAGRKKFDQRATLCPSAGQVWMI